MGALTITSRLILAGLVVAGFAGLFKLAGENGFLDMVEQGIQARSPVVPGTRHTLQTHWTGIKQIDAQINLSLSFFMPIFTGNHPQLSLTTTHFYGCLVSLWTMMLLESYRVGNSWSIISFTMIWGLLLENIGMAIFLPLWCLLHVTLSPTVSRSQSLSVRRKTLLVHPTELFVIPWSIVIGMGIPSAAILYCNPAVLRPYYLSQQFWIVMRQINPFFISVVHFVLSVLATTSDTTFGSPVQRNAEILAALRRVYRFATFIAVISHVVTCTLSLGSLWQPTVFNSKLVPLFHPVALYQPAPFWDVHKVKTIAEGAWRFIQWDEIITSLSGLVWAVTLNREALSNMPNASSSLRMVWNIVLYTVFGGPSSAVIFLLRERDEMLLGRVEEDDVKKNE